MNLVARQKKLCQMDTIPSRGFALNVPCLILVLMPYRKMVCHTFPWAKFCVAVIMPARHRFKVIELSIAVCAKRFELRNIPIKKWLAGMLFSEPYHFYIHFFSICENGIIGLVITCCIELTNKYRAFWTFPWCRIPIAYKPLFQRQIIIRRYFFCIFSFRTMPFLVICILIPFGSRWFISIIR